MTEDQGWIIIALLGFGLFKPRLAMHWYYARKHLFWRPLWRWQRRQHEGVTDAEQPPQDEPQPPQERAWEAERERSRAKVRQWPAVAHSARSSDRERPKAT